MPHNDVQVSAIFQEAVTLSDDAIRALANFWEIVTLSDDATL